MNVTVLILESGKYFVGKSFGTEPPFLSDLERLLEERTHKSLDSFAGEVVFNTAMSGYVEVLSDPSFKGQLVCMTYPHIGNYGVDVEWGESCSMLENVRDFDNRYTSDKVRNSHIMASGMIVRNLYEGPVPSDRISLDEWMKRENICGISGVDTRDITIHLRDMGNENGIIVQIDVDDMPGQIVYAQTLIKKLPSMEGRDLVSEVGLQKSLRLESEHSKKEMVKVGILDLGCKHNIIRLFEERDCELVLFNKDSSAEEIFSERVDMVLVSNGPGDPAVLTAQLELIRALVGRITLCGICLGTQLLALAIGARTYKLSFGHHGVNHPVKDETTGNLYVTSQNHGFVVDEQSLPDGAQVWFRNTNDDTLEGFMYPEKSLYSVQFHPEAAPGPTDVAWIIDFFIEKVISARGTP